VDFSVLNFDKTGVLLQRLTDVKAEAYSLADELRKKSYDAQSVTELIKGIATLACVSTLAVSLFIGITTPLGLGVGTIGSIIALCTGHYAELTRREYRNIDNLYQQVTILKQQVDALHNDTQEIVKIEINIRRTIRRKDERLRQAMENICDKMENTIKMISSSTAIKV
jgi:uncharacterized protein YoxC